MRSTQAQGAPNTQGRPYRPELSAEHGVTLVETLISALVLMGVIFAVFATLDTASSTTAVNRARTAAATIAERDQERMRGMSVTQLSNHNLTRTVAADGVTYTVMSDAEWVRDSTGGAEGCSSNAKQADYIRITSTVTSPVAGRRIKPVELRSLVAPRVGQFGANQGTLAVKVTDELDAPVSGLGVGVTGPGVYNDSTNAQGCAVFSRIPTGNYTIRMNQDGWVDPSGVQAVAATGAVSAGAVNAVPLRYAPAASVAVRFDTSVGGTKGAAESRQLIAANPGVPAGVRQFSLPAAAATMTASGLFPFPDGYAFYSGVCAGADPSRFVTDYFSGNPGFTLVPRGGSAAVDVREPSLNLRITRGPNANSAAPFKDAYVIIRSTECSETHVFDGLRPNGTLPEPGLPFGTYTICADDRRTQSSGNRRKVEAGGVLSNDPGGLPMVGPDPQLRLWINSSSSTRGQCS
ncbi:MAG: hypothetical protein ABW060_18170 [Solirubrobacteraceae bacterium]